MLTVEGWLLDPAWGHRKEVEAPRLQPEGPSLQADFIQPSPGLSASPASADQIFTDATRMPTVPT